MTSDKSLTKSLSTSIPCHKMGINYYIIHVDMPLSFTQPLAAWRNGISKTVAACNDNLDFLPGKMSRIPC